MLDATTIDNFANHFFGYGNLNAPLWFIGMEEGGLKDLDEFERRVGTWERMGQTPLVDLVDFHQQIGVTHWFEAKANPQPTWRLLIRAVLAATDREPSTEEQRSYQATRLARSDGETALLELLPFPNASTNDWPYADLSIERYASRRSYEKAFRLPRLQSILNLIEINHPRVVICYGKSRFWKDELKLQPFSSDVSTGRVAGTVVIATHHPTAPRTTNERWDRIGVMVREHLADL